MYGRARRLRAISRLERQRAKRFTNRQRQRAARGLAAVRMAGRWSIGLLSRGVRIAVALVVVSVVLGGTAFAASSLYAGFGPPRQPVSRLAWADRTPRYAISDCATCHAPETSLNTGHAGLSCEICHAPTVDHPGRDANVVAALASATSSVCVACHVATSGRPPSVPQVDASSHYPLVDCLRCHDPHSAISAAPPEVTHPLANLPACTTCHSPVGLKRYPEGHQPAVDSVCLGCHRLKSATQ